jgi:hypothetical protein
MVGLHYEEWSDNIRKRVTDTKKVSGLKKLLREYASIYEWDISKNEAFKVNNRNMKEQEDKVKARIHILRYVKGSKQIHRGWWHLAVRSWIIAIRLWMVYRR